MKRETTKSEMVEKIIEAIYPPRTPLTGTGAEKRRHVLMRRTREALIDSYFDALVILEKRD